MTVALWLCGFVCLLSAAFAAMSYPRGHTDDFGAGAVFVFFGLVSGLSGIAWLVLFAIR